MALVSSSGAAFASDSIQLSNSQSWQQATLNLQPSHSADNVSNFFQVTLDGHLLAGKAIHFALFSLFPPTFQDQNNGMRQDISEVGRIQPRFMEGVVGVDLVQALLDLGPSFFRWPGGNNIVHTLRLKVGVANSL